MKPVERLAAFEAELAKLVKERDGLRQALGDPKLITWVAERGPIPRRLSSFEVATVKRLALLESKIEPLEDECEELLADTVCSLSGIDGEPDDPEVLLRASLVALNLLHKSGTALPESRVVVRMLLRYLKSLAEDEEFDDA
jgi:hypothetical protein